MTALAPSAKSSPAKSSPATPMKRARRSNMTASSERKEQKSTTLRRLPRFIGPTKVGHEDDDDDEALPPMHIGNETETFSSRASCDQPLAQSPAPSPAPKPRPIKPKTKSNQYDVNLFDQPPLPGLDRADTPELDSTVKTYITPSTPEKVDRVRRENKLLN